MLLKLETLLSEGKDSEKIILLSQISLTVYAKRISFWDFKRVSS